MKKIFLVFSFFANLNIFAASSYAQEQITITTYYPAPVGVYSELRAQRIAIGSSWFDPTIAIWEPAGGWNVNQDTDLIVQGRAGFGINNPGDVPVQAYRPGIAGNQSTVMCLGAGTGFGRPVLQFSSGTGVGNTTGMSIEYDGRINQKMYINSAADIPRLTIETAGNVGIGTTDPNAMLDVQGDTNLCIQVRYTAVTGTLNCPTDYYFMFPLNARPETEANLLSGTAGYFMCCRGCRDWDADGICD